AAEAAPEVVSAPWQATEPPRQSVPSLREALVVPFFAPTIQPMPALGAQRPAETVEPHTSWRPGAMAARVDAWRPHIERQVQVEVGTGLSQQHAVNDSPGWPLG